MLRIALIPVFIAVSLAVSAQVVFKTFLKQGPIVVGEPFQVQYVLEDVGKTPEFYPPEFKDFRFISGPSVYDGSAYGPDGPKKMKNFVYTLEAIRPGKFIVHGASARVDDHFIQSDTAMIEVISMTEAMKREPKLKNRETDASYFLQPGEDPYEKIRRNIYLRVTVDKNNCFVGEPVTATFKLYSRLVSRSDIIKNPGFYGFTVQDMVGLNDRQSAVETIAGRKFDVHTVRKVQLYPLQAGEFIIDPMEVTNSVEFSRSVVNKKAEQEIIEGVLDNNSVAETKNTETFESNMSSKPLSITVKLPPLKNKPADFAGATGDFILEVTANKKQLAKNEEGELLVTISGKGNFPQLTAPDIQWPEGIEGFEPKVTDKLDHTQSPLKGTRLFRFAFVSSKSGSYAIPPVSFSFFNPDSNQYKTLLTSPVSLTISNEEKAVEKMAIDKKHVVHSNKMIIGVGLLALFIAAASWIAWRRKRKNTADAPMPESETFPPSVTRLLEPAVAVAAADDKLFYSGLRNCIWNFFTIYFGLTGSKMNRRELQTIMKQRGVDEKDQQSVNMILQQCETGIFTDARIEMDRKELLLLAKETLERIVAGFSTKQ